MIANSISSLKSISSNVRLAVVGAAVAVAVRLLTDRLHSFSSESVESDACRFLLPNTSCVSPLFGVSFAFVSLQSKSFTAISISSGRSIFLYFDVFHAIIRRVFTSAALTLCESKNCVSTCSSLFSVFLFGRSSAQGFPLRMNALSNVPTEPVNQSPVCQKTKKNK